jgi:hypothetical protein
MLISLNGSTYDCELGDNGTVDTLVYVDGVDYVYDTETAAPYREEESGVFTASGFARFCCEVVIPDNC